MTMGRRLRQEQALPHPRLAAHEYRVRFLETLAHLAGCHEAIGGEFPDGSRPDVLQIDRGRGLLFVGDAKNTEVPQDRETQARLQRYLKWLKAHVEGGREGVFALCFRRHGDLTGWIKTLQMLAQETGLMIPVPRWKVLDPGVVVIWVQVQPPLPSSG